MNRVKKVHKVIKSCETESHFRVALNMMKRLENYHEWYSCYCVFVSTIIKAKFDNESLTEDLAFEQELRKQQYEAGL